MGNQTHIASDGTKILIAYYSLQGNTKRVAECIQTICNASLHEIKPLKPYSVASAYTLGLVHTRTKHLPKLTQCIDLSQYKTIVVGTPIWAYTLAPPVRSFMKECSFAGKDVAFFCTHGGNVGSYFNDMKELCTGAKILEGRDFFRVSKMSCESLREDVMQWSKSIFNP